MASVLITGGTRFVSRYFAEYYVKKGWDVYVLNRNTKKQSEGVNLIEADRHALGDRLKGMHFDLVIDNGRTTEDENLFIDALDSFGTFIFISSAAVYPVEGEQPYKEDGPLGYNAMWGTYGINKVNAEKTLFERLPDAYVMRPCYIYGPMNTLYRESFVFDCAEKGRKFYVPEDGETGLQFIYIEDMCRLADAIYEKKPEQHIINTGNNEMISINDWVKMCYDIAGAELETVGVYNEPVTKNYFSFDNVVSCMDVETMYGLIGETKPLREGLEAAYEWFKESKDILEYKPYMQYIDEKLA